MRIVIKTGRFRIGDGVGLGMVVMLLCIGSGCRPKDGKSGASEKDSIPPGLQEVTVQAVEEMRIEDWGDFSGRTEAMEKVEIRPRVSGHLKEVKFEAGQLVEAGQVLFVIDPRWHQAEVDRAEAQVAMAEVQVETAEREAGRTIPLLEKKAISKEEGEGRQSRFRTAKANLLSAQATLDTARLDLEVTEIKSPIAGRVSRAWVTEGNYVSGVASASTVLTTVVSVDPIFVYVDVDEHSWLKFDAANRSGTLQKNDRGRIPVSMTLGGAQDRVYSGYLESVDNQVQATTGSMVMRAEFPNPDGDLVPGLFARVRIPLSGSYPALLIGEEAIGTDQSQKYVLTLGEGSVIAYRPVQLGGWYEGKRIVLEGLKQGEGVVVNGMARVRPGMPVTSILAPPSGFKGAKDQKEAGR